MKVSELVNILEKDIFSTIKKIRDNSDIEAIKNLNIPMKMRIKTKNNYTSAETEYEFNIGDFIIKDHYIDFISGINAMNNIEMYLFIKGFDPDYEVKVNDFQVSNVDFSIYPYGIYIEGGDC